MTETPRATIPARLREQANRIVAGWACSTREAEACNASHICRRCKALSEEVAEALHDAAALSDPRPPAPDVDAIRESAREVAQQLVSHVLRKCANEDRWTDIIATEIERWVSSLSSSTGRQRQS